MDSFISWVGGKRLLRKDIIKRLPKENIEKYVEGYVIGGLGWFLWHLPALFDGKIVRSVGRDGISAGNFCGKYLGITPNWRAFWLG